MQKNLQSFNKDISHKFIIRIQSVYGSLKSAEKRAADTILEKPKYVFETTITDVAKLAGCSEATLVRLARKLGYNGYPELKSSVLNLEEDISTALYNEISPEDNAMTIVDKVFNAAKLALTDTQTIMDPKQYEIALDYIIDSNQLFFIGAGDAYVVAYSAYLKFSRIGYHAGCSKDFDVQLVEASKLTRNDVLIIISHSGKTQSLYDVAKCAKLKDTKIIAITNFPISPIAKIADVVILTSVFTPNTYNEIMAKRIPELSIIEALYINTLIRSNEKHQNILLNSNKSLSINKI